MSGSSQFSDVELLEYDVFIKYESLGTGSVQFWHNQT